MTKAETKKIEEKELVNETPVEVTPVAADKTSETPKATEDKKAAKAAEKAQAEADRKAEEEAKAAADEQAKLEADAAKESEGSKIAAAITAGLKGATEKNFSLQPDAGVIPRFAIVKNKQGEVMVRENETGHLSKVQLESLEEKENSIQGQEVTEI